jgi:M6 family metalloprotease-like protein
VKRLKVALVLALVGIMALGQSAVGTASASKALKLSLPSYQQPDKDFRLEAAANGQKVTGKQFRPFAPGHSYKSPVQNGQLNRLDVRGHGRRGLAILVDWPVTTAGAVSDVPGVTYEALPQYLFSDLVNGDTYNPYELPMFSHLATHNGQPVPTDLTMKNYYNEVSYGQFGMTVDMVGWVTLPHDYNYYLGQNNGYYNENGDAKMGELVKDALMAADAAGVDFSQYAVPAQPGDFADLYGNATSFTTADGQTVDMVVPNLFIIHRGTGAEYSRDPSIIWSHKWDLLSAGYYGYYYQTGAEPPLDSLAYTVMDGVALNTYNIVPEVGQDISGYYVPGGRQPSPPYVGVFAHEFGHVLGLPDLYDYGYDSEGVGIYSLMAGGSYGRTIQDRYYSGNSPSHMEGWGKYYLGFADFTDITPSDRQSIVLRPVEQYPDIYRVHIPGSNGTEYFVLENRQQQGFDKGLAYTYARPADGPNVHGLAVYQVDENVLIRNFWRPNEAQSWDLNKRGANTKNRETGETHYGISVLQADGRFELEKAATDGDAGDLFPGAGNKVVLLSSAKSAPNTLSWVQWHPGTQYTGIELQNIVEHEDGTVTLDVVYQ